MKVRGDATAAVLGIDAAWTLVQPSGVALVAQRAGSWHLVTVASSYRHFLGLAAGHSPSACPPTGSVPDATALISASRALCGRMPDVVAIDMPLSLVPITSRRASDNAVSRAYGSRWWWTHTPSCARPGKISDDLREDFTAAGFLLQTVAMTTPGLIEVYPHPALVELAGAPRRLPYKASNIRKYWPDDTPRNRRKRLVEQWGSIVELLDAEISGVADALRPVSAEATGIELKAYEDALDAIVCAWIGICAIEDRAIAYGDEVSAIWVPQPAVARRQVPASATAETTRPLKSFE